MTDTADPPRRARPRAFRLGPREGRSAPARTRGYRHGPGRPLRPRGRPCADAVRRSRDRGRAGARNARPFGAELGRPVLGRAVGARLARDWPLGRSAGDGSIQPVGCLRLARHGAGRPCRTGARRAGHPRSRRGVPPDPRRQAACGARGGSPHRRPRRGAAAAEGFGRPLRRPARDGGGAGRDRPHRDRDHRWARPHRDRRARPDAADRRAGVPRDRRRGQACVPRHRHQPARHARPGLRGRAARFGWCGASRSSTAAGRASSAS